MPSRRSCCRGGWPAGCGSPPRGFRAPGSLGPPPRAGAGGVGSPPSAAELLRRHAGEDFTLALAQVLLEWERWSAELLETHLSYPLLAYYRSQHEEQSWLAGLTTILDVASLIIVGMEGAPTRPARLAFAMARHAAADLSHILGARPLSSAPERLSASDLAQLRVLLAAAGVRLREGPEADKM